MAVAGVEVKPGQPLKCDPGFDKYLHLSQASLGEAKKDKGNESIPIFVTVGGQKLVLGTLSPEKCTQITFELVFEKEFELSPEKCPQCRLSHSNRSIWRERLSC